ncbi:hypothetical protein BESB_035410 [Besnoitia besnoiti]|uniref:Transmembrane protein n=1 Tax=Besnoitia besnoiti TaxID=94643 RepID=A0A2A9MMP4_BESBE|nr:hypothetical protein BESB_035410 [Besnoitia besnoiti]PFH37083.1 hypothetical protein BESB_035410 [Besnoitia besnoiti]
MSAQTHPREALAEAADGHSGEPEQERGPHFLRPSSFAYCSPDARRDTAHKDLLEPHSGATGRESRPPPSLTSCSSSSSPSMPRLRYRLLDPAREVVTRPSSAFAAGASASKYHASHSPADASDGVVERATTDISSFPSFTSGSAALSSSPAPTYCRRVVRVRDGSHERFGDHRGTDGKPTFSAACTPGPPAAAWSASPPFRVAQTRAEEELSRRILAPLPAPVRDALCAPDSGRDAALPSASASVPVQSLAAPTLVSLYSLGAVCTPHHAERGSARLLPSSFVTSSCSRSRQQSVLPAFSSPVLGLVPSSGRYSPSRSARASGFAVCSPQSEDLAPTVRCSDATAAGVCESDEEAAASSFPTLVKADLRGPSPPAPPWPTDERSVSPYAVHASFSSSSSPLSSVSFPAEAASSSVSFAPPVVRESRGQEDSRRAEGGRPAEAPPEKEEPVNLHLRGNDPHSWSEKGNLKTETMEGAGGRLRTSARLHERYAEGPFFRSHSPQLSSPPCSLSPFLSSLAPPSPPSSSHLPSSPSSRQSSLTHLAEERSLAPRAAPLAFQNALLVASAGLSSSLSLSSLASFACASSAESADSRQISQADPSREVSFRAACAADSTTSSVGCEPTTEKASSGEETRRSAERREKETRTQGDTARKEAVRPEEMAAARTQRGDRRSRADKRDSDARARTPLGGQRAAQRPGGRRGEEEGAWRGVKGAIADQEEFDQGGDNGMLVRGHGAGGDKDDGTAAIPSFVYRHSLENFPLARQGSVLEGRREERDDGKCREDRQGEDPKRRLSSAVFMASADELFAWQTNEAASARFSALSHPFQRLRGASLLPAVRRSKRGEESSRDAGQGDRAGDGEKARESSSCEESSTPRAFFLRPRRERNAARPAQAPEESEPQWQPPRVSSPVSSCRLSSSSAATPPPASSGTSLTCRGLSSRRAKPQTPSRFRRHSPAAVAPASRFSSPTSASSADRHVKVTYDAWQVTSGRGELEPREALRRFTFSRLLPSRGRPCSPAARGVGVFPAYPVASSLGSSAGVARGADAAAKRLEEDLLLEEPKGRAWRLRERGWLSRLRRSKPDGLKATPIERESPREERALCELTPTPPLETRRRALREEKEKREMTVLKRAFLGLVVVCLIRRILLCVYVSPGLPAVSPHASAAVSAGSTPPSSAPVDEALDDQFQRLMKVLAAEFPQYRHRLPLDAAPASSLFPASLFASPPSSAFSPESQWLPRPEETPRCEASVWSWLSEFAWNLVLRFSSRRGSRQLFAAEGLDEGEARREADIFAEVASTRLSPDAWSEIPASSASLWASSPSSSSDGTSFISRLGAAFSGDSGSPALSEFSLFASNAEPETKAEAERAEGDDRREQHYRSWRARTPKTAPLVAIASLLLFILRCWGCCFRFGFAWVVVPPFAFLFRVILSLLVRLSLSFVFIAAAFLGVGYVLLDRLGSFLADSARRKARADAAPVAVELHRKSISLRTETRGERRIFDAVLAGVERETSSADSAASLAYAVRLCVSAAQPLLPVASSLVFGAVASLASRERLRSARGNPPEYVEESGDGGEAASAAQEERRAGEDSTAKKEKAGAKGQEESENGGRGLDEEDKRDEEDADAWAGKADEERRRRDTFGLADEGQDGDEPEEEEEERD